MAKTLLIKNGKYVDPVNQTVQPMDILVEDNLVAKMEPKLDAPDAGILDAAGCYVTPGLIDMHVHLREPGREDEETIYSGTRTAALGGITSVASMANTNPPIDDRAGVSLILAKAREEGVVNVFPIAAITKQMQGEELTEFGDLKAAGAVAVSDDGVAVMNAEVMRRALEYSIAFDLTVIQHAEDKNLAGEGVMNEGYWSTILGLRGIPNTAESIIVGRDILLSEMTGAKYHVAHISTLRAVDLVRGGKRRGVKVTCEVMPHHFTLTDESVKNYDSNTKMNPPLRSESDRQALLEGLRDGTIDVIASDHAPHAEFEKEQEYDRAPFGIVGLQTILPLTLTELVHKNILTIEQAVAKMTINPARILGIDRGVLAPGKVADITVIDPHKKFIVTKEWLNGPSRNTPFIGMELEGCAMATIVAGRIVMKNGQLMV
jgi:dihydroorotase